MSATPPTKHARFLRLIAIFKLIKAAALLGSLAAVLKLLHHDPAQTIIRWALELHVDPANHYLRMLLALLLDLDPHRLELLAGGTTLYVMLFAAEGVGLLMERAWAEYLTITETAGFIPLELYEIVTHVSCARMGVLAANMATVAYLAARLQRRRRAAA